MTLKILNKRSVAITGDVSDAPLPSDLEYGEIAVNYSNVDPALFIRDSNDVVRRFPVDAGPNEKYAIANDSTLLVGNDTTTAINAALIASGDIVSISELHVSDQCQITDSGSPDFNAVAPIGQYLWDGTLWFVGGGAGGGVSQIVAGNNVTVSPTNGEGVVTVNSTGIGEAPVDGQQYGRRNAGWSVITGGGGGTTINYNGASAWALTDNSGNLLKGLNIASVTRSSSGKYDYVFSTPMPSADYSLAGSVTDASGTTTNGYVTFSKLTSTGFQATTKDNTGSTTNRPHSLAVFALNALPPEGGTGTDAWAACAGGGAIYSSFNIATYARTGAGLYTVTFTTPMPDGNYGVVFGTGTAAHPRCYNRTTTGFNIQVTDANDGASIDSQVNFAVNATNATLPLSFTSDQIESAINNPGLSAWGDVGEFGDLLNGLNCTTNYQGGGIYTVTFTTPMPSDEYSVNLTGFTGQECYISSQSATGFSVVQRVTTTGAAASGRFSFQVAATNALPPKGGTGTDAWGSCEADGTINASFNVESVTNTGTGVHSVVFTTPMPSSNYSVVGSVADFTGNNAYVNFQVTQQSTTGFTAVTAIVNYNNGGIDYRSRGFNFQVNATNATLPTSFTEAQIQSVVDLAQAGLTANSFPRMYGCIQGIGSVLLLNSYNTNSVTYVSAGTYRVEFPALPSADYVVVFGSGPGSGSGNKGPYVASQTTTSFIIYTYNGDGQLQDANPINYVVYQNQ